MSFVNGLRRIFSNSVPHSVKNVANTATNPVGIAVSSLERSPVGGDLFTFSRTVLGEFCQANNLQSQVDIKRFLAKQVTAQNLLGRGQDYKVYAMGDYVLRIPQEGHFIRFDGFKPLGSDLGDKNFGQAIARNSKDVEIAKRVQGTSLYSGLEHPWVEYTLGDAEIGEKEASVFFEQLQKNAAIPEETIDEYAKDAAFLAKRHYEIDYHNPNNFLYDEKTQRINMLDVTKSKENVPISAAQLAKPLVDYRLFEDYYRHLSSEQRRQAIENMINIFDKVGCAASKAGLPIEMPDKVSVLRRECIDYNNTDFFSQLHSDRQLPFPEWE